MLGRISCLGSQTAAHRALWLPEFEDSRSPGICAHSEVTSTVRASTGTHALSPPGSLCGAGASPPGRLRGGRGGGGRWSVLMCKFHFFYVGHSLDALDESRPAVPSRAVLLTFPPYLENTKVIFPFCHRLLVPGEDVRFSSARV